MVNYSDYICRLYTADTLVRFIVIHEDDIVFGAFQKTSSGDVAGVFTVFEYRKATF